MIKANIKIEATNYESLVMLLERALLQAKNGDEFLNVQNDNKDSLEGEIIDTDEEKKRWEGDSGYSLSENQIQFCKDAEDCGLDIDFSYSGRGMFGETCPSVTIPDRNDITTSAEVREDSMGRDVVVYAEY